MASLLFNIARICNSQFKCKYLKNEKRFLNFLFHIWIPYQVLHILKKMMMVIANVFPKLQTVKNFVTQLCNKGRLGTRLDSRHVKASLILGKSPWECLYHFFFINLREVDLENISACVRWNLRGVCLNIHCQRQVVYSILRDFATPNSNASIWKTKKFF